MRQFKLKKGKKIGALAAESDVLLEKAFYDTGFAESYEDTSDPHFLILGRTGSGKTALMNYIEKISEHTSRLDPEALSMQYLHSNTMLKTVAEWGVHLDVFFKYLWRHIIIMEVIKLRYGGEQRSSIIEKIKNRLFRQSSAQSKALEYLECHGQEYWVMADTHVKAFTEELEHKLAADSKLTMAVKVPFVNATVGSGVVDTTTVREKVEKEIVTQAQRIVNDYQIAALNEVMEKLGKESFGDPGKKYYVFIDDLDKNWMPDDDFYLELLKGLLYEVKEINARLRSVKIIVAMRTNIYYRLFKKAKISEPQREKWADVRYELQWNRNDLIEMIDLRLAELYREQYTRDEPKTMEVLPAKHKRKSEEAVDYMLDRTFYRPRDVIQYFNICLERTNYSLPLSWNDIKNAEAEYSKQRLNSLIDEWKDSYYGIHITFPIIRRLGAKWKIDQISEDDVISLLTHSECMNSAWLSNIYSRYDSGEYDVLQVAKQIVTALYMIGMCGIKIDHSSKVQFSYQRSFDDKEPSYELWKDIQIVVHKMIWREIGITQKDV